MNKSQKIKLINNLKECLSYLSPDVEQQISKGKKGNIAELLTSITNGINLVKELITERKGVIHWKKEYYTILQLINEEERKGRSYTIANPKKVSSKSERRYN